MPEVSALTRGEIQGLSVQTYIRREMHKNRTYTKFMIHLCQINRADAYLSIVLAGGHFEVCHLHFIQDLLCNYCGPPLFIVAPINPIFLTVKILRGHPLVIT